MVLKVLRKNLFYITWVLPLLLLLPSHTVAYSPYNSSFTPDHIRYLQNETRALLTHSWDSYMKFAFPYDEITPITCQPYGPDWDDFEDTVRNDARGNISLMVLDNLDTLIIFEKWDELEYVLKYLRDNQWVMFEQDTIVQVFETSIRHLGGLLSAHLLLTDVTNKSKLPEKYGRFEKICDKYDGFLLKMAHDLGMKLIPSYKTKTNIPVPRINLKGGLSVVPPRLQKDACTSGVMTPVLEFTLLSKLTGDYQFEYYTQLSFWKLWSLKLELNLLPMTIDPISNYWKDSISGIGANIDSFYEYAAKSSILFNDDYMWSVFKTSYKALLSHLAQGGKGTMIFPNIGVYDGVIFSDWIDLLGAFWSGLQVLTGQLEDAIKTHIVYLKIWDYFDLIPERWKYNHNSIKNKKKKFRAEDSIDLEWYPLRPEFIESTYYLYRATRDPMYLQIGERVLNLLNDKYKAPCGLSGLQDVRINLRQDVMESFVVGETLKYLYLLFDTNDEIFLHDSSVMNNKNWIFSTEAHPLWLSKEMDVLGDSKDLNESFSKRMFNKYISKSTKDLIDTPNASFIRNITLPTPRSFEIESSSDISHIAKRDPFAGRFEMCQLNPWTKSSSSFLESSYYKWPYLFNADYAFAKSLKKPRYLNQTNLDGSYVELTKDFYDKFTMFGDDSALVCPRMATTSIYEVFWGDIKQSGYVEISEIYHTKKVKDSIMAPGDLWIPELDALRVVLEELVPGKIDTCNNYITEDYILSLQDSEEVNQIKLINSCLRIKRVNGITLEDDAIVWTLPFEQPQQPSKGLTAIAITSDARVVIQGKVVENLLVWYG
ncbi:ER degradation-enhancing alpha-mannosidase-like protein 1 [Candida viswanathii]|uniref:alpha-1,2-Mannosidase n=1 Tax=Candida viswanathii TaxID=5486 RepID=A0A367YNI3_9ASCO|nr:ER degradation-enhancing alpha-mannosidase-like protein 1 [Candida viswanathii]